MINTLSATKIFHPLSDKNQWPKSRINSFDQRMACIALSVLIGISTLGLAHLIYFISSTLYNRSVKPIQVKHSLKNDNVDQIPLEQPMVSPGPINVIVAQAAPGNFQRAKKVALYFGIFLTLAYISKTFLPNAVDHVKEEIMRKTKQICLKEYNINKAATSLSFNFDWDIFAESKRNYVHKLFKLTSLNFHHDKSPWLDKKFYDAANKGKETFDNYLVCLNEHGTYNFFGYEFNFLSSEQVKHACQQKYNLRDASKQLSVAFDMNAFEKHKMQYVNLIYKTIIDITKHINPILLKKTADKLDAAKKIFSKYINCTGL